MTSKSKRLRIIFTSLAGVAIGQVLWWSYLLISQREELTRWIERATLSLSEQDATTNIANAHQQMQHFTAMILAESTFFIAVWALAMWSAFRFTQEQAGLRQSHSDFLSAITHELKTPLANVQLSLDTLERPELTEEMRLKYIKRGQAALARLLREIETVLIMTNTEIDSRQIQELSLADLVDRSVQLARESTGDASQIRIEGDTSLNVIASAEEARLILQSLIDNAIKYHLPRNEASILIRTSVGSNGRTVKLEIIDQGVGLSADELEHAFQPFWRAEKSKSEAIAGTGLGLALARSLGQRMNLKVELSSPGPEQGTTATVTFPRGHS